MGFDCYCTPLPDDPDRSKPAEVRQSREAEPSIISEKTVADFTRVVEQIGILERGPGPPQKSAGRLMADDPNSPADRQVQWSEPRKTTASLRFACYMPLLG